MIPVSYMPYVGVGLICLNVVSKKFNRIQDIQEKVLSSKREDLTKPVKSMDLKRIVSVLKILKEDYLKIIGYAYLTTGVILYTPFAYIPFDFQGTVIKTFFVMISLNAVLLAANEYINAWNLELKCFEEARKKWVKANEVNPPIKN